MTRRVKEHLGTILSDITKLVEREKITPLIDRTFSFDEIAAAYQYAESGNNIGKVGFSLAEFNNYTF